MYTPKSKEELAAMGERVLACIKIESPAVKTSTRKSCPCDQAKKKGLSDLED